MNYSAIYDRLIERARERVSEGYTESHHVLPRSLGGSNDADNLVSLTAREHFLAHWLLFKLYPGPAMAKAFKLLCHEHNKPRGRSYEQARVMMSQSMLGDKNVAKRPEVKEKISRSLRSGKHPFLGKKRPEHGAKLKGKYAGERNPMYGKGYRQTGGHNPCAKAVRGTHPLYGKKNWGCMTDAAKEFGVTVQAIAQALRKGQRSKGWTFERVPT